MSSLLSSFEERASELSAYMKFLELLESESAALLLPRKQTWKTRKIDERILPILKATFFLMLYNLVEASTREGFRSLYAALASDGCKVKDLTPTLRALWVEAEFAATSAASANQGSYRKIARRLVQQIMDDEQAQLDVGSLKFGGSLDAAKIRQVCDAHGVPHKTHQKTKGGEKLLSVKHRRNALAHGEMSFVECGRDYSVTELGAIKNESVMYVRSILRNIDSYNSRRGYRVWSSSA